MARSAQKHSAIGTSISNEGWRHLGPQATAIALIDQGLAGQRLKERYCVAH